MVSYHTALNKISAVQIRLQNRCRAIAVTKTLSSLINRYRSIDDNRTESNTYLRSVNPSKRTNDVKARDNLFRSTNFYSILIQRSMRGTQRIGTHPTAFSSKTYDWCLIIIEEGKLKHCTKSSAVDVHANCSSVHWFHCSYIFSDGLCVTLKSINLPLNHLMPISEIKFIAKFGFGVCNAFIVAR